MRSTFRCLALVTYTLFAIEFLDELVYSAKEAAWPFIRNDLQLTYTQIGLLLSLPALCSNIVEPFIGILGDVWRRRALILGGGTIFAIALLFVGTSYRYLPLLLSLILLYPASGAFVTLSQATLMDLEPGRHEQNMARWTLAGSLGDVLGPLALSAAMWTGLGWRGLYLLLAGLTLLPLGTAMRVKPATEPHPNSGYALGTALKAGFANALNALRRGAVLRWLTLIDLSDLMADVLLGFLALYFVDIANATPAQASLAVLVRTAVGLLGDLAIVRLLEHVPGLRYVRWSVGVQMFCFALFLLLPGYAVKVVLLALVTLFASGWYPILQAQLYSALPGQSGTVMTIQNLFRLASGLVPLGLGWIAEQFGLNVAMWLLLIGPLALLVGLPRAQAADTKARQEHGASAPAPRPESSADSQS